MKLMEGIAFLLFLILNHMVHNSIKDCLKFYLKKFIKRLPDGILTFLATYFLSLLILYICIGIFMLIFVWQFDFGDFFSPTKYFRNLVKI